ncbi:hypothetical protein PCC6912_39780 [Chlorogloeopsis fritschii PCC 6912]|uniref:Uncharacterized protein n=1 Tax=Chlorogloeopsis fritschii PCC 6912 TaxID=211165 RepID=A0A433N6B0_CHLFR|nr:hypothetical protein [Chlorogloeopsis fritschii]RUR77019.1 hypothetical protein PCC6912_39780 [Chlorogloeopsis fritschii PCC 6912]
MVRIKDPKTGLFVASGDRRLIKKSVMLNPEFVETLQAMREEGESLSDKVNEAIAYYLVTKFNPYPVSPVNVNKPTMHTSA